MEAIQSERIENYKNIVRKSHEDMSEWSYQLCVSLDSILRRWGLRDGTVLRREMCEILEKSFGAKVEKQWIGGEQFDIIIVSNQHILIEIAASAGKDALKRLQRKRDLYIEETGVTPARFIFAVGSIYGQRIEALCNAGFEVIQPEEPEVGYDWSGNQY